MSDHWRIVTTGRNAAGFSTIVEDRLAATRQLPSGRGLAPLWSGHLIAAPARPDAFPPPDGVRVWVFSVPAEATGGAGTTLHTTPSVDFGFVLRGSVELHMGDGTHLLLQAGDVFVQQGTEHRWANVGTEPAAIGLVILVVAGGEHTSATRDTRDQ
jgi:mannose-6-phosphate isomerase-like protein (cupin superfamily)